MNLRRLIGGSSNVVRILRVLGAAAACAVGARIVAPGIDGQVIADFFRGGGAGPLLQAYDWLAGGAVARGALFALGALPYVAARVYAAAAAMVAPTVAAFGRRRATIRGLTLGLASIQSYGFARFAESIPGAVANPGVAFIARTMIVLTASAMCAMWLCETPASVDDDAGRDATAASRTLEAQAALAPALVQLLAEPALAVQAPRAGEQRVADR